MFDLQEEVQHGYVATMSKKQRHVVNTGADQAEQEADSIEYVLKKKGSYTKQAKTMGMFARCLCILPLIGSGYQHNDTMTDGQVIQFPEQFSGLQEHADVDLIVSYSGSHGESPILEELLTSLDKAAENGKHVCHFTEQFPNETLSFVPEHLTSIHGSGNISVLATEGVSDLVKDWLHDNAAWEAPKATGDILEDEFIEFIDVLRHDVATNACSLCGYPAEMQEEARQEVEESMDAVHDLGDASATTEEELLANERSMLEEIPLPGTPIGEAARKIEWLKIPRPARAAIRRLHNQFGHCPKTVLVEILKNSKADESFIRAAKHFSCDDCSVTQKLPKQTSKVSVPKPYEFNHTVGVDVNTVHDHEGNGIQHLNIVCMGTSLQIEVPIMEGKGVPSSKLCLTTFMDQWVEHYGYPKVIRCDRGLHEEGRSIWRWQPQESK